MRIPSLIEFDSTVAQELSRADDIQERADKAKAAYRALHAKKLQGVPKSERDAQVAAALAGQAIPDTDIDSELRRVMQEWHVLDEAANVQASRVHAAKKVAGKRLPDELKPEPDKLLKRLCASLSEAFFSWKELHAIKSGFHAQG